MKHVRVISNSRPARAELEGLLQLIGVFQAALTFPTSILSGNAININQVFGAVSGGIGVLSSIVILLGNLGGVLTQWGVPLPQKSR